MKNINFNINLKFILILNLIILISSILIYYLYQNKNFIDFLKKQLPSDDIQIKNQIKSVEDIYGKKSTKAPKPPSPPPTIPSPPKPPPTSSKPFGSGSSKVIRRNGKNLANVSAEQLKKTGMSLRQYMNAWNKTGNRPTKK